MLLQVSAVFSLLGLAFSAAIAPNLPSTCSRLDCPHYTVLARTDDYELRHYNSTMWVAVDSEAATYDNVRTSMFMTLFHYIDGDNANHVKIPMTAPVLTKITHGDGPNCASNFTMHFLLPHDLWQSPIQPTNPAVKLVTAPAQDVYVRSFPGWARDEDYIEQVMQLHSILSTQHATVDTSFYYTAGYNGPYDFANRHNEVWLKKL